MPGFHNTVLDDKTGQVIPYREALLRVMMKRRAQHTLQDWIDIVPKYYDSSAELAGSPPYLTFSTNLYTKVLESLSGVTESDAGVSRIVYYIDEPNSNASFSILLDPDGNTPIHELLMLGVYLKALGINNVIVPISSQNSRVQPVSNRLESNRASIHSMADLVNSYRA